MMYESPGGLAARGEGADRVEEVERGSRERSHLRSHVGLVNKQAAETLGMA